jgi:hypothetical protein
MTRYIRHIGTNGIQQFEKIWRDDDGLASEIGVVSSAPPVQTAKLEQLYHGARFYDLRLAPGEYFPRMARPFSGTQLARLQNTSGPDVTASPGGNPDSSSVTLEARTASSGQLHALIVLVEQICRVLPPKVDNFAAYGHELRNILLVASTEVEAQCKGILRANGKNGHRMLDYFLLNEAMKLDEYVVKLSYYPWLEAINPFQGWVRNSASRSLSWYNAYNQVKHDRETCFSRATLGNVLSAVTACFVLLCAQYGWNFALSGEAGERAFFRLIGRACMATGRNICPW